MDMFVWPLKSCEHYRAQLCSVPANTIGSLFLGGSRILALASYQLLGSLLSRLDTGLVFARLLGSFLSFTRIHTILSYQGSLLPQSHITALLTEFISRSSILHFHNQFPNIHLSENERSNVMTMLTNTHSFGTSHQIEI